MIVRKYNNIHFAWLILLALVVSCVDPIEFDVPPPQLQTVVEGYISDDPGPYTVKVSKGFSLDAREPEANPVMDLQITLIDDLGLTEAYVEVEPGLYQTNGVMQGELDRSYHIRIETPEGDIFESEPDMIRPTGALNDVSFEFEARIAETAVTSVAADVFKVFIDGNAGPLEESYTRWRYKGTYEVLSYPHLHKIFIRTFTPIIDPLPCSGYVTVGCIGATKIKQVGPCECCTCYPVLFEDKPQLSDNRLVDNGVFRNVKVAEVPISNVTFHNKFRVEIDQMSMTREAFDFFRLVRAQKEDASSFFQPTFGEIIGNIKPVNNDKSIVGFFWGTSIATKSEFITRDDVPYPVVPIDIRRDRCDEVFPFSSLIKPDGWD